jgi:hypothetical protein
MTIQTLERILEALEQSEPKAKHYPEPNARHQHAITLVKLEIAYRTEELSRIA